MKKTVKYLFSVLFPLVSIFPQHDLSGYVTFPDSTGIDLIRVEVWQSNQQVASTITDSLGYFEIDSIITGVNSSNPVPSSFELYPNYPSPFDKSTNIIYEVDKPGEISITIFNSIGQEIKTLTKGFKRKGTFIKQWDGKNGSGIEVAQGIYFARLDNGKEAKFIKLLKMNGALNATVTGIPNNFYRFYKGSNVNEDYLIKFIDANIVNRVDYAEITISLPAVIHQILTEAFIYTGPGQLTGKEGDTLGIAFNWFQYGTALDSLINDSKQWQVVGADQDSLYLTTTDPNANGNILIILKAKGQFQTENGVVIPTNLADLVTLSGKIVDNDFYWKLEDGSTGPPIPGYVKVAGQSIYTPDGLFTVRLPPTPNVTFKAQSIVGTDTLSFESSHDYAALVDNDNVILHPVTFEGMDPGQGPLFKLFYYLVNDKIGHFNYSGKKYMDKSDTSRHKFLIPRINDLGDTVSTALQDSVENYLVTKYIPGMQLAAEVVKLDFGDPTPIGEGGGQWIVFIRPNGGSYSGAAVDFNNDGIVDEAYIKLAVIGGHFFWNDAGEEFFTGEVAVNNLNDLRLRDLTLAEGGSTLSDTLYPFDKKLRKIGENYPPLEDIDRILGNIDMIDP